MMQSDLMAIELQNKIINEYQCDAHRKAATVLRLNDKEVLIVCIDCIKEQGISAGKIMSLDDYIKSLSV